MSIVADIGVFDVHVEICKGKFRNFGFFRTEGFDVYWRLAATLASWEHLFPMRWTYKIPLIMINEITQLYFQDCQMMELEIIDFEGRLLAFWQK